MIDGETGIPEAHPPKIDLATAVDVRREQAKVYREARGGRIDKGDASKLIWMLGEIRKSIELEEIERRVAELEEQRGLRPALPARAHQ